MKLKNPILLRSECFVDGKWINPAQRARISVTNPANGKIVGQVPSLIAEDINLAIIAAEKAQKQWAKKSAKERSAIMRKWFELMVSHADDLALMMTTEQGKPLAEAKGEALYAASFAEWFAEEGKRIYGDTIPAPTTDKRILVLKQPIGVCAAITPWNFPAAMITRKAAPALVSGCAMIVKPAGQTPLTALALAVLAEKAGFPAGIFQVVTGEPEVVGAVLTQSPIVRKLSFTGSTEVGRILMRQSADTIKKLSLELGGNAPFIVFDDANLDAAVDGAIASKYRNAGQTCVCSNRLYVQSGVHDAFVKKLVEKVAILKVGAGDSEGVSIGPLIDEPAIAKVENHVEDALAKGAQLVLGGKRHSLGGTFFEPTVLIYVTQQMRVAKEETFGPVAPIFRFNTEEEAISMANDTEYGLAAYFYTENIGRSWRVAEGLEYGMVGHNTGLMSNEVAPFGGVKQSGLGREGSKYGIEEYLELKYVCLQIA